MTNPSEDKIYNWSIQFHLHTVVHVDFRAEFGDPDLVLGWTWFIWKECRWKRPTTLQEFKDLIWKKPACYKIDLDTGKFKLRQRRGGKVVQTYLLGTSKAPEPKAWMEIKEAKFKKGTVGATPTLDGFMKQVDSGQIEFGAQKVYFHEYWLHHNKVLKPGRYVVRLARKLTPKDVKKLQETPKPLKLKPGAKLPPAMPPEIQPGTISWWIIQAVDQSPYVLSRRAILKRWLPPKGVSAMPRELRDQVPDDLKFWEVTGDQALDRRKGLRSFFLKEDVIRISNSENLLEYDEDEFLSVEDIWEYFEIHGMDEDFIQRVLNALGRRKETRA